MFVKRLRLRVQPFYSIGTSILALATHTPLFINRSYQSPIRFLFPIPTVKQPEMILSALYNAVVFHSGKLL